MLPFEVSQALEKADHEIKNGSYWLVGGGIVTLGTYASADPGGSYLIFWGPAAYGALKIYRGYKLKAEIQKIIRSE